MTNKFTHAMAAIAALALTFTVMAQAIMIPADQTIVATTIA